MILVIGERINNSSYSAKTINHWQSIWNQHGWTAARRVTATGGSLRRLDEYLPAKGWMVVNLLPPNTQCGTWSTKEARRIAQEAVKTFHEYDAVVLLGRRVAAVVAPGIAVGEIQVIDGTAVLSLPHPSGRCCSFWSKADNQGNVRWWISQLLRTVE
jgi:hypothetical protein